MGVRSLGRPGFVGPIDPDYRRYAGRLATYFGAELSPSGPLLKLQPWLALKAISPVEFPVHSCLSTWENVVMRTAMTVRFRADTSAPRTAPGLFPVLSAHHCSLGYSVEAFMSKYKANLLLVEDDPQLRILMGTILTQCGYLVRSAHDGFSGLEELRSALPDIILSDLYMAGMSGFDFLAEVRRTFPAIPLIAMSSAYTGTEIPPGVVADAFYEKASSIDNLLKLVERQRWMSRAGNTSGPSFRPWDIPSRNVGVKDSPLNNSGK